MSALRSDPGYPAPFRERLLPAEGAPEVTVQTLFGALDREGLWNAIFDLLYKQHGGSGLSLTLAEILDLEYDRMMWFHDRLADAREEDAKAIKNAARGG